MQKLQLTPLNEVEFSFKQVQDDGAVIEYSGTAAGMELTVENDYDDDYGYGYNSNSFLRAPSTTVTAKFRNPKGTYKKTPKTGVVRTATVVIDKLTSVNIDEARRKAGVGPDMEFTIEEKTDPKTLKSEGYSIKFVWTD